jgi:hypothetical protein
VQGKKSSKLKGKVKDDLGVRINRLAIVRSQLSVVRCVKGIEHRGKTKGEGQKTGDRKQKKFRGKGARVVAGRRNEEAGRSWL